LYDNENEEIRSKRGVPPVNEYSTIAAVDLGSNSFRLQGARVVDDQIYPLDSLRENVRLAAGLDAGKCLDEASQLRALECLARFGERLRGLPRQAVRVVGTSTLRVAKNTAEFQRKAEAALGFPIEVVAGREEARLIYLGVAHGLPPSEQRRLVVDIGGGSTECIIGTALEPFKLESLRMGCVNFTQRFFADGKVDKASLKEAELAARAEVQYVAADFKAGEWDEALGSSGTARALADILEQSGYSTAGITRDGLAQLRGAILKAGDSKRFDFPGMKPDRKPVLAAGFAVMSGIFAELGIERMTVASAAMREGILYDLLGRVHHQDMRDATGNQFMRRYHVDPAQAERVERLAVSLFEQTGKGDPDDPESPLRYLIWAARLHEIGISIAHTGYHKHSAYIVQNADMPGFSKMEQARLALLVRAQRGAPAKVPDFGPNHPDWRLVLALRLAVLFHRSRAEIQLPQMRLECADAACQLSIARQWLEQNPLTEAALQAESKEWKGVGLGFKLVAE
jgi:exopolyphosphatase/guanosine-5'-triphosphate,3'-diphosphate pyrophosphatase